MKIFAVTNGKSGSDFGLNEDWKPPGSNAHSGGLVILAETLEEAIKIAEPLVKDSFYKETSIGTLKEVSLEKAGVVLECDGNC